MGSVMKGSGDISTGSTGAYAGATVGEQAGGGLGQQGVEQAKRLTDVAKERAVGQLDGARGQLAQTIDGLAENLEKVGRESGGISQQAFGTAAQYLRRTSDRIQSGSPDELMNDVRDQFRQRPGLFIAGLVGVGFLAGRILRT